jgi:hypothetical protein
MFHDQRPVNDNKWLDTLTNCPHVGKRVIQTRLGWLCWACFKRRVLGKADA